MGVDLAIQHAQEQTERSRKPVDRQCRESERHGQSHVPAHMFPVGSFHQLDPGATGIKLDGASSTHAPDQGVLQGRVWGWTVGVS